MRLINRSKNKLNIKINWQKLFMPNAHLVLMTSSAFSRWVIVFDLSDVISFVRFAPIMLLAIEEDGCTIC